MSFESDQPEARRSLPLAPMLDILFLLLVFFVTTSTFQAEERQMDVMLPTAETAPRADASPTQIVINVLDDGSIQVGPSTYTIDALGRLLGQLVDDFPNEQVVIRGDQDVKYQRIIRVMDTARAAGIRSIYFATVKSASQVTGEPVGG